MTKWEFYEALEGEFHYAENKYPGWPTDALLGSAILQKELDTLVQVAFEFHLDALGTSQTETRERMRKAAARVGAMALRFSIALDSYRSKAD